MAHQSTNPQWTNSAATPINSAALENIEGGIDALATAVLGAPGRTRAPAAYAWLTSDNTPASGRNYLWSGGLTLFDPEGVIYLGGGTAATPTSITMPVTGRYLVEYHSISTATSGALYNRIMLNADTSQTETNQTLNFGMAHQGAGGLPEATFNHLIVTKTLNAGDKLTFGFYSTVAFTLKSTWFSATQVTGFGMRYLGPA